MKHLALGTALVLAGCAQAPDAAADAQALAGLVGPATGPAQNCVPLATGEGLTVLTNRALGYRRGRTVWVNHVPEQCRLSAFGSVILERDGTQACRGDRVRTIETGASIPGPACVLGQFVPHAAL